MCSSFDICEMATSNKAIKKYQRSMRARLRLWAWMQVHELGVDWARSASGECLAHACSSLQFVQLVNVSFTYDSFDEKAVIQHLPKYSVKACFVHCFVYYRVIIGGFFRSQSCCWIIRHLHNYPDSGSAVVNAKLILVREFGTFVGSPKTTVGLSQISFSHAESSVFAKSSQHFQHYLVRRFDIFSMVKSF
jgi:hypothetical protein